MLLRCEECGKEPRSGEEARSWRAYLTVLEEGEPEEVVVYCPDCAKRTFEVNET
jgi:ribosomal protein L44E